MHKSRHIGFFGGTFNPVHVGHLILADYISQFTDVDEVWLSVSPLNPLKAGIIEPVDDSRRVEMLRIATGRSETLKINTVELEMPRPNYTIDTLSEISRRNPGCRFSLIIGSDNWLLFNQWYKSGEILARFSPIVYPRPGYDIDPATLPPGVTMLEKAPLLDISSTFIRDAIADGHDMQQFVGSAVWDYITAHKLYRHTASKNNPK